MTEGTVVTMILQKENAIAAWRNLMGATDPAQAEERTIRKKYGASLQNNATHGSDAEETAAFETRYFFNAMKIVQK
jgi:nucleoside-diphosphate kinase